LFYELKSNFSSHCQVRKLFQLSIQEGQAMRNISSLWPLPIYTAVTLTVATAKQHQEH